MGQYNAVGDQWDGGPMRMGPMGWGTNGMGNQWADPAWWTHVADTGLDNNVIITSKGRRDVILT